ncbi:excitatory amino acid transporter 1-like [Girardinichthys multiradiatus]|uniref:excitatory amino acid transporter 1-like n=1 Tax=Girardinichthys multiradiatus TaxID=208333 RepID=UPI001FAB3B31|nr:excitatory amino acid transporter 1-like [Girardinichthys multiradiatus]
MDGSQAHGSQKRGLRTLEDSLFELEELEKQLYIFMVFPCSEDMSDMDSVEIAVPEEKQTNQRCPEPLGEIALIRHQSNIWVFLKRNAFVILTMTAVGIGLGFALRHINMAAREIKCLMFPGEMLLRMMQMMVLPLVVSSVIAGLSNVDRRAFGKIGLRTFIYYFLTIVMVVFTGISLVVLIQPGKSSWQASKSSAGKKEALQSVDAFLDLIRNIIPSNLVEACFRKYKTVYRSRESAVKHLEVINVTTETPMSGTSDGINIVGLLVFSIGFGLILSSMGTEGKPLRDLINCLNKTIMLLVKVAIWYSPVGIIFLMAGQVVKMTDAADISRDVAMYTLTVITGLIIHGCVTLPLIYFIVTRKNPLRFYGGILQALSTAFGTSSSSATLPVTLHCMEENHKMDKQVTRFMLPIGATMNMDGAALYEAVAALFIAQVNDMDFNLGQIIVLSLIVTAVSTGSAGIPQAGMVSMLIVLCSTGLPTEDISLLLMVDWIVDRIRTAINVLGDCIGVGVVQHLSRHELQKSSPAETRFLTEENPTSKSIIINME